MDQEVLNETVDSPNDTVANETGEEVTPEPVVTDDESVKLKEQNQKLFERAKKAEAEAKDLKSRLQPVNKPEVVNPTTDPVYLATLANEVRDFSKEEMEFANDIAKARGSDILTAIRSKEFQTLHKVNMDEKRKEDAKLGASRGSGSVPKQPDIGKMSREEHEAMARKMANF